MPISRRLGRAILISAALLTVALPVAASLWLSYRQALEVEQDRVAGYASEALARTTAVSMQLGEAVVDLAATSLDRPCAPETLILMRRLALGANAVVAVGYIANDRLLCSSFGLPEREVAVGPPDYTSAIGYAVRLHRVLSIAPGTPLVLASAPSGFTGIFHPIVALGVAADDPDSSIGIVAIANRVVLDSRGAFTADWRQLAFGDATEGTFMSGGFIVAWKRPPDWDYFAYAARPAADIGAGFRRAAAVMVPVGIVAGLILTFLLRRIVRHQQGMPTLLRAALRRRELRVMYQPIVDMRTGAWVGAEVLVRWLRPNGEWVPPDVFIPMAEATGLVTQVTDAVMERMLSEMDVFLRAEPSFFVSINVAGADLRDTTLPLRLGDLVRRHGMVPASLHFEVTERELLEEQVQLDTLERLRAAGYSIAADDFGVGYSNLSYLDIGAFDYLKIDRFFVTRLGTGKAADQVIPSIVAMAAPRAITLIAEGVETAEQAALLLERGVALGQGYHFARPMVAAALVAAVRASVAAVATA